MLPWRWSGAEDTVIPHSGYPTLDAICPTVPSRRHPTRQCTPRRMTALARRVNSADRAVRSAARAVLCAATLGSRPPYEEAEEESREDAEKLRKLLTDSQDCGLLVDCLQLR